MKVKKIILPFIGKCCHNSPFKYLYFFLPLIRFEIFSFDTIFLWRLARQCLLISYFSLFLLCSVFVFLNNPGSKRDKNWHKWDNEHERPFQYQMVIRVVGSIQLSLQHRKKSVKKVHYLMTISITDSLSLSVMRRSCYKVTK